MGSHLVAPHQVVKPSQLAGMRRRRAKSSREGFTTMKIQKEGRGLGEDPKLLGLVVHKEEREVDQGLNDNGRDTRRGSKPANGYCACDHDSRGKNNVSRNAPGRDPRAENLAPVDGKVRAGGDNARDHRRDRDGGSAKRRAQKSHKKSEQHKVECIAEDRGERILGKELDHDREDAHRVDDGAELRKRRRRVVDVGDFDLAE